jgi:adenylosuccinate lyase
MFVYPERMLANLESTRGLIFSGQLLLDLVEHGVSREDAYRTVQAHAMRAWREGLDFHDLVIADKEIAGQVPRKQLEYVPSTYQRQLKNVDKIFARVFGKDGSPAGHVNKRAIPKTKTARRK